VFLNPRLVGYVPNPPPHVGWASTGIHIQSFLDVANDDTPLHAEALVHFGVGSAAGSFPSRARPPKDEILLVAAAVWSPIRTCSRVRDQSLTRGRGDNPEPRAQALVQVGGVLAAPVGVEDHTFDVAAPDGHGLARRFRFRVLGRTLQEVASSAGETADEVVVVDSGSCTSLDDSLELGTCQSSALLPRRVDPTGRAVSNNRWSGLARRLRRTPRQFPRREQPRSSCGPPTVAGEQSGHQKPESSEPGRRSPGM
jgi:hypothetical protein